MYQAKSDSTLAAQDLIQSFSVGDDVIDLSSIDAIAGGGDDDFVWRGTAAFSGNGAGQVRYEVQGSTTLIEVRLAGSGVDDMQIVLNTVVILTDGNFVL